MPKPNSHCFICKKAIYKIPSRLSDHPLCSYACRNKYFSQEHSFVWKGGKTGLKNRRESFQGRQKEKERRSKNKKLAIALLGGKCVCCGYNRCYQALDFHHLNFSEKDCCLRHLSNVAWKRIVKELKKCILLCSNCHREVHQRLRNNYKNTKEIIQEIIQEISENKINKEKL